MAKGFIFGAFILVLVLGMGNNSECADHYPNRDITFIVPYGTGGSTDPIARVLVPQMEKILKTNINIVNKPGGTATIGTGLVVRAKPDGYTIGLSSNSALAYQPLINSGLAYNSQDDYQPIVKLADVPAVLVVRADAPWKTFDEFMDNVKKNPGKIRCSNSGFGATDDLVVRQLNKAAGVDIVTVSFSTGGGEAMVALLGGRVESSSRRAVTAMPFVKSGQAKILASFTKGKYYMYPEAPAIGDTYEATLPAMYCLIAPNGMPKEILDKLISASIQAIQTPEYVNFCNENGMIIDAIGPEETRSELKNYSKVFADLIVDTKKN